MRRVALSFAITLALGAGYLGWTWLQRHEGTLRMERAFRARHPESARSAAEGSGTGLKITQFYARAGTMTDAERNLICYGVRQAKSVRLEPAVESLTPSLNRCFWVEPKQDTSYTLVAEGFHGERESAVLQIAVQPAPPHIDYVAVSHAEIRRGEPVTVCYGVDHAKGVRLEPLGMPLPAVPKNCNRFYPRATLIYTLVAFDAAGRTDREKFSIRVK
jgi:hypothetical protein